MPIVYKQIYKLYCYRFAQCCFKGKYICTGKQRYNKIYFKCLDIFIFYCSPPLHICMYILTLANVLVLKKQSRERHVHKMIIISTLIIDIFRLLQLNCHVSIVSLNVRNHINCSFVFLTCSHFKNGHKPQIKLTDKIRREIYYGFFCIMPFPNLWYKKIGLKIYDFLIQQHDQIIITYNLNSTYTKQN